MNFPTKWKGIEIIWITDIDKIKIKILGICILRYWNGKSVLRDPTIIISCIPGFRQFSLANDPKKPSAFLFGIFVTEILRVFVEMCKGLVCYPLMNKIEWLYSRFLTVLGCPWSKIPSFLLKLTILWFAIL